MLDHNKISCIIIMNNLLISHILLHLDHHHQILVYNYNNITYR